MILSNFTGFAKYREISTGICQTGFYVPENIVSDDYYFKGLTRGISYIVPPPKKYSVTYLAEQEKHQSQTYVLLLLKSLGNK